MDWKALLLGLLLGWIIEWIIDWYFWRSQGSGIKQEDYDRLKSEKESLQEENFALQTKLNAEVKQQIVCAEKLKTQEAEQQKLKTEIDRLSQEASHTLTELQNSRAGEKNLQNKVSELEVELSRVQTALDQHNHPDNTNFLAGLGATVSGLADKIKDFAQSDKSDKPEKASLLAGLGATVSGLADKIKDVAEGAIEAGKHALAKNPEHTLEKNSVLENLKSMLDQAKDKMGHALDSLSEKAAEVVQEAQENLSQVGEKLKGSVAEAKNKAADVMGDAKDTMESLGEKVKDNARDVQQQASHLLADTKAAVEERLHPKTAPKGQASSQYYSTTPSPTAANQGNLIDINGIGEDFAERLGQKGIHTFADLVALTSEQIVAAINPVSGEHVNAESWIKQARSYLNKQVNND